MWLLLTSIIIIVILFLVLGLAYFLTEKPAPPLRYLLPEADHEYTAPKGWKGTPVDGKQRFVNYEFPFYQDYIRLLRWLPSHLLNLIRNRNRQFPAIIHSGSEFLFQKDILIWLGHASFYININGTRILIDPQFYHTSIYKRHTPAPIAPELFTGINYILIFHDHQDHCDKKSIRALITNNPEATILSGLNMDKLLQSFTSTPLNVQTADWYRKFQTPPTLNIHFTPSRHYCKRLGKKFNGCLWGGFIISYVSGAGQSRRIYFEGDSGESSHFADVKNLFAPDLAIIGIGAYNPKWFMFPNHMSPQQALSSFDASGAAVMIPMHFGTFNLSNEGMEAPIEELHRLAGHRMILTLTPGEILLLV